MNRCIFIFFAFFTFLIHGQEIDLELFQDGLDEPVGLYHSGDARLFIVEKSGIIKIIRENGQLSSIPFLDISDRVSTEGERGLLGLAFHPDHYDNLYFYVNYTDLNGDTKISRFLADVIDPNISDPRSEEVILEYSQPETNHNGGDIKFGPDGFLYISSGDGGEFGDPNHRAQSITELLGKILRIDVDHPSGGNNYGIPSDNPFVNTPDARPEIWAVGLRNPWRFTIDTEEDMIWIADVGQADREEINRQPLSAGGINYGWRCYEGTLPFNTTDCPPESDLTFPIAEYPHENGNCSITGGQVYRGWKYSDIADHYFFADYCSGMIAVLNPDDEMIELGNFDGNWVAFGEDYTGELYIVDISGGKIFRVKGGETTGIEDIENLEFNIFPNPASESFRISNFEFLEKVEIIDSHGRKIFISDEIPIRETIDVSEFRSGIYFVKIKSQFGSSEVKKLIIQ